MSRVGYAGNAFNHRAVRPRKAGVSRTNGAQRTIGSAGFRRVSLQGSSLFEWSSQEAANAISDCTRRAFAFDQVTKCAFRDSDCISEWPLSGLYCEFSDRGLLSWPGVGIGVSDVVGLALGGVVSPAS